MAKISGEVAQQLIDENLDSDGHAQRTIDRLKEAMVKEKNNG